LQAGEAEVALQVMDGKLAAVAQVVY